MSITVNDFFQPEFFVAFMLKLGLIKRVAMSIDVLMKAVDRQDNEIDHWLLQFSAPLLQLVLHLLCKRHQSCQLRRTSLKIIAKFAILIDCGLSFRTRSPYFN